MNSFKIKATGKYVPKKIVYNKILEEENNLEKTVEIESTPKLENGENVQEISYTEADEVEQQ